MHWLLRSAHRVGLVAATYSATLCLTSIVVLAGWWTHGNTPVEQQKLLERIGSDVNGFGLHRLLTIPFATFIQSTPGVEWHMVLLVAVPLAMVERSISSRHAAVTFLLSDWISAPLTLLAIWSLARLGSDQAASLLDVADAGSSAAAHGTLAVACLLLPGRWRRTAILVLYAYIAGAFFFQRLDAATAHLLATIVGTFIGLYWLRDPQLKRVCRPI